MGYTLHGWRPSGGLLCGAAGLDVAAAEQQSEPGGHSEGAHLRGAARLAGAHRREARADVERPLLHGK